VNGAGPLDGRRILVTGVMDEGSLAFTIAQELRRQGAVLVCVGLGPTPHHRGISPRAGEHLAAAWGSFERTIAELGADVVGLPIDVSLDASVDDVARQLARNSSTLDGVVHAIALDRTIRNGTVPPMMDVTRAQFLDCLDVSAYSLLALIRALLEADVLMRGASVVALSYLGAARVPSHPYRNIAIAKAALERLVIEMADELGRSHAMRVNAVRFSPWAASRAGGAIPRLAEAMQDAEERSPLGNARPEDLAIEVAHLLRSELRITGEIRHVDGGFHARA